MTQMTTHDWVKSQERLPTQGIGVPSSLRGTGPIGRLPTPSGFRTSQRGDVCARNHSDLSHLRD